MKKATTLSFQHKTFLTISIIVLLCNVITVKAQFPSINKKIDVLFVGDSNSTTNNLPAELKKIAESVNDTIQYNLNAPRSYSLQTHSYDPTTLSMIKLGNWDFVILQEQSQEITLSEADVEHNTFAFASKLDTLIRENNKCAQTIFYQTWGYKNGDIVNCLTNPLVCDYEGMDDLIDARNTTMTNKNNAILSPVGKVFRALKNRYPAIELSQPDGIHASTIGTYAAALTFYTILFRKDPTFVSYHDTISTIVFNQIRTIVRDEVFIKLPRYNVYLYDPISASITTSIDDYKVDFFTHGASNIVNHHWDFGDGTTSNLENPTHTYTNNGTYHVEYFGDNCKINSDTEKLTLTIDVTTNLNELVNNGDEIKIHPNPTQNHITFTLPNGMNSADVSIYNLLGINVKNEEIYNKKSIDLTTLPDAIYYIQISNKNKNYYRVYSIEKNSNL